MILPAPASERFCGIVGFRADWSTSAVRRPLRMTPEDSGAPPPGAEQERAVSIPGLWCVFED